MQGVGNTTNRARSSSATAPGVGAVPREGPGSSSRGRPVAGGGDRRAAQPHAPAPCREDAQPGRTPLASGTARRRGARPGDRRARHRASRAAPYRKCPAREDDCWRHHHPGGGVLQGTAPRGLCTGGEKGGAVRLRRQASYSSEPFSSRRSDSYSMAS